jgi:fumarylacetoacetate (FAA) hydrolase
MKLGSLNEGRDGRLVVVSRDLTRALPVPEIAPTMRDALDRWDDIAPRLAQASNRLNASKVEGAFALAVERLTAPLPRASQWADGSAYLVHMERVRAARGAEMPKTFLTDPLIYQGGSDPLLGPREPIPCEDESWGVDLEAEVAVITGDVPAGASPERAARSIRLILLVNDVSLRNLIPAELAKGFGFFWSKPPTAFSPVAVTPDELGPAWDGRKVNLPLLSFINGTPFGRPNAGVDMQFDFPALIAHAARTRPLGAGTIVGSGTVANRDPSVGQSCIAEKRAVEMAAEGKARTPFLNIGDRVRIEMLDASHASIFGAIDQQVVAYRPAS